MNLAISQHTIKVLFINWPHNPTGYTIEPDLMKQIIQLCKENNIILFSDEVYS